MVPSSRARARTASGSVMNTVSYGLKADSSGVFSSVVWTAMVLRPTFDCQSEIAPRTRQRIDDAANVASRGFDRADFLRQRLAGPRDQRTSFEAQSSTRLSFVVTERDMVREYFWAMDPSVQFLLGSDVPTSEGATIHPIAPPAVDRRRQDWLYPRRRRSTRSRVRGARTTGCRDSPGREPATGARRLRVVNGTG